MDAAMIFHFLAWTAIWMLVLVVFTAFVFLICSIINEGGIDYVEKAVQRVKKLFK